MGSIIKRFKPTLVSNFFPLISLIILLSITIYTAIVTAYVYVNNSDALVAPFLFKTPLSTINLLNVHSNIFKFPLFILQGIFPYHFGEFLLVNVLIAVLTVGLWLFLLIKLFGRKYIIVASSIISLFLLSSTYFTESTFSMLTIRNIEFSIALIFVYSIGYLFSKRLTKKYLLLNIIIWILFSFIIAGDYYFIYVVSIPLLIMVLYETIIKNRFKKSDTYKLAIIITTVLAGLSIQKIFKIIGINFYKTPVFNNQVVSTNHLASSFTGATNSLLSITGSNIFGKSISLVNSIYFLSFILLVVSIIGFFLIIKNNSSWFSEENIPRSFVLRVYSLSFFLTFIVYFISGLSGQSLREASYRYIAFMVFMAVFSLVFIMDAFYKKTSITYILPIVILLVTLFSFKHVISNYDYLYRDGLIQTRSNSSLVNYLEKKNIKSVVSDYWTSLPIKFYSNSRIIVSPVVGCKYAFPFNSSDSWYKPSGNGLYALIINNGQYSIVGCNKASIISVYGQPIKKEQFVTYGHEYFIWIYKVDIIKKISLSSIY